MENNKEMSPVMQDVNAKYQELQQAKVIQGEKKENGIKRLKSADRSKNKRGTGNKKKRVD